MKIVAVGDLHGDADALWRLLDAEAPDGVLGVGDWGDPGQFTREAWDRLLDRAPVLTVFGNHDDLDLLPTLRNRDGSAVLLAQGERRDFRELVVVGVSGIWAKSHRLAHYVTDEDVAGWASALSADEPTNVLLTHGCPLGVADRTPSGRPGGQRCFLDLLQAVRPHIHLCGHLHLAQRRDLSDPPSAVFNTGALPKDGHPYVRIERGPDGDLRAEALRLGP